MLERNIPTWQALEALDSGYEINNKSDYRDDEEEDAISTISNRKSVKDDQAGNSRNMKLVKAYLLNDETLNELKFGGDLTEAQFTQVKQMLISHSQCFALTLGDAGAYDYHRAPYLTETWC